MAVVRVRKLKAKVLVLMPVEMKQWLEQQAAREDTSITREVIVSIRERQRREEQRQKRA